MASNKNDKNLYHVDEAGDLTFFSKGKPVNLNAGTASKFFIIGVLKIKSDVNEVHSKFEELRTELVNDPFIKKVPSIGKTANFFHAKDDCTTVRREVFKLIKSFNFTFQAIVRRKEVILNNVIQQYQKTQIKTQISERDIYNEMIKRLFKNLLHKEPSQIVFAERGKTFNNESLKDAIEKAKKNFYLTYNIKNDQQITIIKSQPSKHIGLQIADYYLWALQRLYEKEEIDFLELLIDDYKLIQDVDDKRDHGYGEWYNKENVISVDKIKGES